jgi:deoxyribodipyrimidine photo-lyase
VVDDDRFYKSFSVSIGPFPVLEAAGLQFQYLPIRTKNCTNVLRLLIVMPKLATAESESFYTERSQYGSEQLNRNQPMADKRGLYLCSIDLRLNDNPALTRAAEQVDELLIVYAPGKAWFESGFTKEPVKEPASLLRWKFLIESLTSFDQSLGELGQHLVVSDSSAEQALPDWIERYQPTTVFRSAQAGWFENELWQSVQARFAQTKFITVDTHTLFVPDDLPICVTDGELPATFSAFRRKVEKHPTREVVSTPRSLPPPPADGPVSALDSLKSKVSTEYEKMTAVCSRSDTVIHGGESVGQQQLAAYFSSDAPSSYKLVRNELDGWVNSTKFSLWLSLGCISAPQTLARLHQYEKEVGANESTYWIFFELLWREYFQHYARVHGQRLFALHGIKSSTRKHQVYDDANPARLTTWQSGQTDYPIVNACMNQLSETGFMSNRGRQLVASCLVNELALDWRLGASWFEHHLIDYDVASNWGNWQYLAGVGADPRGKRQFNLTIQTETYDPTGEFVRHWT